MKSLKKYQTKLKLNSSGLALGFTLSFAVSSAVYAEFPLGQIPSLQQINDCQEILSSNPLRKQKPGYYDENHTSEGKLRPVYAQYLNEVEELGEAQKVSIERAASVRMNGVSIDSHPRILSESEYQTLKTGVQQRGKAIQKFLQDYYSGKKSFLTGEPNGFMPPQVLARIVARTKADTVLGKVDPARISFEYGPDIHHAADGNFYSIEDNQPYPGGMGDLGATRETFLGLRPDLTDKLPLESTPSQFYADLVDHARKESVVPKGEIVFIGHPGSRDSMRLGNYLKVHGVKFLDAQNDLSKLVVRPDGVYLRDHVTGNEARVGYVFVNTLFPYISRSIAEPGLAEAVLDGRVASDNTPNLEIIGDKELHGYVDQMSRFYLREEPLLQSIPSRTLARLDGENLLDEEFFKKVLEEGRHKEVVFKDVAGMGGKDVFIGPKLTSSEVLSLTSIVRRNPALYVAQSFWEMSQLEDMIVDQRLHSVVGPRQIVTSPVPISRGSPAKGDGKVNISGGGRLFAVFIQNRAKQ